VPVSQGVDSTERCDERVVIPLGTVVRGVDGRDWVFVGWPSNSRGPLMMFVQSMDGMRLWHQPWMYHVVMLSTALAKFPGLAEFVVPRNPGDPDVK
jgi:hypothetical protein